MLIWAKYKFLLSYSIVLSLFTQAQDSQFECFYRVNKLYKQEKNYQKALLLLQTCPDSAGIFGLITRGKIYYEMGEYDSAVHDLRLGIARNNGFTGFESAFMTLTDTYIKLVQFDNARQSLVKNASVNKHIELFFAFGQYLKRTYREAQIFAGLDFKDSAISVLTPYMFKDKSFGIDEEETEEITNYYFSLLKEKYGLPKSRRKIKQAVRMISFSNKVDTSRLLIKDPNLPCHCSADYFIVLWGKRIPFKEGLQSSRMTNDTCTCPERYTLKYAINRIKNSYLYSRVYKRL